MVAIFPLMVCCPSSHCCFVLHHVALDFATGNTDSCEDTILTDTNIRHADPMIGKIQPVISTSDNN